MLVGTHIFYLVDEAQHSNKGANTVTSMLHHHFMYHNLGEKDVRLHMDNYSGQNKNNTVIGYKFRKYYLPNEKVEWMVKLFKICCIGYYLAP